MAESEFAFACPDCAAALSSKLACTNCGRVFEMSGGIYRFLLDERRAEMQSFLAQYRLVRDCDGYRSHTPEEFRRLPTIRPDSPQAQVWSVRRESYDRLTTLLNGGSLSVLDLGAGNCWLSHCLAKQSHRLVAVDWLDDEQDGLGAHRYYPTPLTCVQADYEALPFLPNQFDAVIFNASLHYTDNLEKTLRHACSMLRPEGRIFVIDSPTFYAEESGQRMLKDQREYLRQNYGLREVIQRGVGYLSMDTMMELGKTIDLTFRYYPSHGPLLWAVKRWWAGVRNGRDPAAFGVWEGTLR